MRLLLERGARADVADADGALPLHDAAAGGYGAICGMLLDAAPGCIDRGDGEGDTPLHNVRIQGCWFAPPSEIQMPCLVAQTTLPPCLLRRTHTMPGVNTPAPASSGICMQAARGSHDEVVELLLSRGADACLQVGVRRHAWQDRAGLRGYNLLVF